MKKKKKIPYFVLAVLYLAGLIIGLAIMISVPYFQHRQGLLHISRDSANNYSANQDFGITAHFGMHYLACDLKGNCLKQYISGYPDTIIYIDTAKYQKRLKKQESALYYDYVEMAVESTSKHCLCLVAASPIRTDGNLTGIFFLIRELMDLSSDMIVFLTVWSLIFLLLLGFYYLLAKKEAALEQLERTYIASMNHQLKSPITSIKALSTTLLDGYVTSPEKQLFYYSTILKEANILENTVQEILELSRLQSTKTIFQKETVTTEAAFGSVLERYQILFADIDVLFSAPDFQNELFPKLYTAPHLAARVLELLLHNASKFVREENGKVTVSFTEKKEHIIICVRDNGCGIAPDALPLVFNRFYKEENPHNKTGCGLGLSIVKEIMDGLGESVWAESELGSGSAFSFTISTRP